MSGALLAVARAAGETAPLLFTIGIVDAANGTSSRARTRRCRRRSSATPTSPFAGAQERAYGAALTLILIVFIFTALARIVTDALLAPRLRQV